MDTTSPWTVPGPACAEARGEAVGPSGSRPLRRMNPLAVVSLVLSVLFPPAAALLSGVALWQISRSGQRERGGRLAVAGLSLGVLFSLTYGILLTVVVLSLSPSGRH